MIWSFTRFFIFWWMKASSRWGTSFQHVLSARPLRICVASNLQQSYQPVSRRTSALACGCITAASLHSAG